MMHQRLGDHPSLIRSLHYISPAEALLIKISPGRFRVVDLGGVSLVAPHHPSFAGKLLAAKLNSAVVVAKFDIRLQDEVLIGSLADQEGIHFEGMAVAQADDDPVLDGPADGIAVPSVEVLAVEKKGKSVLLFLGIESVDRVRRSGPQQGRGGQ